MNLLKQIVLFQLMIVLVSCNENAIIESINSGNLIGGEPATEKEFNSTVSIGNCTASKIGPKVFISAAHCLVNLKNLTLKPLYKVGNRLSIQTHYQNELSLTIKSTHIHESFLTEGLRRLNENANSELWGLEAFDVALITVLEESPSIPEAKINKKSVSDEVAVVIGGYGCEVSSKAHFDYSLIRYKIQKTSAIAIGKLIQDEEWKKKDPYYFVTLGQTIFEAPASLCPGDSGGPVYLVEDGSLVGLNSFAYDSDDSGISAINGHTHLSGVLDWIETILALDP